MYRYLVKEDGSRDRTTKRYNYLIMIENSIPLYSKEVISSLMENDSLLYHYTSVDGFCKMLTRMELRLSCFEKANDFNEAYIYNFFRGDFSSLNKLQEVIKNRCRYVSFSSDYKTGDNMLFSGINHPRMWAQYAKKGEGLCVVFNKQKLLEINSDILNEKFYKLEKVNYSIPNAMLCQKKEGQSEEDYIKANYKNIFYIKHSDWSQEAECRFFIIDPLKKRKHSYLSINGAIECIALGPNFIKKKSNIEKIDRILDNKSYACCGRFIAQSFAEVYPSELGYFCGELRAPNLFPRLWKKEIIS